jgi:integrase
MALTDAAIRNAPIGEYADGANLYLVVRESGRSGAKARRSWMLRVVDTSGRRRRIGLGAYPAVGLAEARQKAQEARRAIGEGNDPSPTAKARQRASEASKRLTLGEAIARYLREAASSYKNPKSDKIRLRALNVHFAPLHGRDVATIAPTDVAAILRRLAPNTAVKAHTSVRAVFDFAAIVLEPHGVTFRNPADPRLLRHLGWEAQNAFTPYPSLDWRDAPAFMTMLSDVDSLAARLLEFAILTVARVGAARLAKWADIDLERRIWVVPLVDLKDQKHRREPFVVPFSSAAIGLIERLPRTGPLLFGAIDDQAITRLMRRIHRRWTWKDPVTGKPVTAHGFRSSFRTWSQDNRMNREVAELTMGHAFHGAVERAYARSDLLDDRRRMLEAWGRHCQGEDGADVIPLRRPK